MSLKSKVTVPVGSSRMQHLLTKGAQRIPDATGRTALDDEIACLSRIIPPLSTERGEAAFPFLPCPRQLLFGRDMDRAAFYCQDGFAQAFAERWVRVDGLD